jgi:rod shape-determining protein MreB
MPAASSKKDTTTKKDANTLLVGIDLGTSRSVISAGKGRKHVVESYVGWPKDFLARRMLGKDVLFGEEALERRLSLELYRPLEHGVIKEGTSRDQEAIRALVRHLIGLVDTDGDLIVNAVVGVPAESLRTNKLAIKEAVASSVQALMVVSEPFAVAYAKDLLDNALIIDIGAGTMDFCIMHGTIPSEDDQRTVLAAGDYIDRQLHDMMVERFPNASFNLNMVRRFKEMHSFVGAPPETVEVDLPVAGKPVKHDITEFLRRACESILPAMVETTTELIARFDPEYQAAVRQNVVLAGGGSQIRGLAAYLEAVLEEYGPARVQVVDDPVYSGADGALALARDMPAEYWERL